MLTCDPGIGVVRHADAGYPEAIATARAHGIDMPMRTPGGAATMMIPERPVARAARARGARRLRPAAAARFPVVARRLRHRPHVAAAAAARSASAATPAQYVDVERIATTPERFLTRCASRRRSRRSRTADAGAGEHGARDAFDAALAFLDTARGAGGAPATFLLDEFLELRTFESFPGLRTRAARSDRRAGGERQPLRADERYVARAHRLLRDAPARFEIMHVAPLTRGRGPRDAAGRASTASTCAIDDEDDRARDELARLVHALSDGRPVLRAR